MKITKRQLQKLIKEELDSFINEQPVIVRMRIAICDLDADGEVVPNSCRVVKEKDVPKTETPQEYEKVWP